MTNTIIKIKGMHCKSCKMLIEDILEDKKGINSINVNLEDNEAKIDFNEKYISLKDINNLISNEGFEVE